MTLDPAVASILEMMKTLPFASPPFSVEAFRAGDEQPMPVAKADVAEVRDISLDIKDGAVAARLYHPAPGKVLPVLVFFHGGGWVAGNLETHDALCRALAVKSGGAVVSVDYPRAPENPFPGPLNACFGAVEAVIRDAASLGADAARLAVGGDSAGGNLAAAVCLMARERSGPSIVHQLLIYPVTDSDFTRPSYTELAEGFFLTGPMMRWFWGLYVSDPAKAPPLAAPCKAEDLAQLPSATIITAEYDPLRDDGKAYAARLREAGVAVKYEQVPGVIHGFASMLGILPQADAAADLSADALRTAWN